MRLFAALLAGLLAPCPALRGGVSRSRAASQLRGGAAVSNSTDAVEAFLADKFQGVAAVFGANALRRVKRSTQRASLEQFVEDKNAVEKASGSFKRYVLVLPMTEHFEPPRGTPGFGKLEFSDHCSMPASFANEITRRALEVPWHFELKPLDDVGPERDNEIVQGLGFPGREARGRPVQRETKRSRPREGDADGSAIGLLPAVKRVFCAPIDFRAPENFVFVPVWMLRQLRLEPYDVATLTSCTLKDGVTIELQPHQDAFLKLANPRAVLESELKYYTCVSLLKGRRDGAECQ